MRAVLLTVTVMVFLIERTISEDSKYTEKYDNIDLDEILASERLLTSYVNCLLDRGPCTPDGKELKRNIPDAIQSDCSKCTAKQKEGSDRVMDYIIDHRPDDWAKLEEKYNSDGSYKKRYLERMNHENKTSNDKTDAENKAVDDNKAVNSIEEN